LGAELTLIGKDLIRLLLGPKWAPAGTIFTFFGPGIGIMLLYYTQSWIHLSIGRADRWFRWGVAEFIFTALIFLLALHWGPNGIAAAWTASFWILTVPGFWYAGKPIGLGIGTVLAAIWKFVVASVVAGCATALVMRQVHFGFAPGGATLALARVVSISFLFVLLYLGSVILMHRGLAPLRQVGKLLRDMVPWDWGVKPSAEVAVISHGGESQVVMSTDSSSKPLVSILIPAHNAQNWIADTLHSAIAQTWERKEIIVVDDGSIDQTLAIARQFESDMVRVVSQKNQGAASARNHAFSLCKGDYIQWLDADDILAPDKIARQMEVMGQRNTNKKTLLSSAWGQFMHRPYRANFIPTSLWCDLSPVDWLLCKMGQNLYMQTATWLVHRDLAEAVGPWDTRLLSDDDGEYFCRVLLASDGVRFVPESRVYYRGPGLAFRSLSFIGQSNWKIQAHWVSMQLHIKYLRSLEESARVREACLRYLQTSLGYFYPDECDILKQVDQLAAELGGKLQPPRLSWKYYWMKTLFGWRFAKRGQLMFLRLRWSAQRFLDETAYRLHRLESMVHGVPSPSMVPFPKGTSQPLTPAKPEGADPGIGSAPKIEEKISGA
jgi:glycosyltransferase involved in cell wall biosynthesis